MGSMGLIGARSYIQRNIASKVLAGLIYRNFGLYIDDVLNLGITEEGVNEPREGEVGTDTG